MEVNFDSTKIFDLNIYNELDESFVYNDDYVSGTLKFFRINPDLILTTCSNRVSSTHIVNEQIACDYFIFFFMLEGGLNNYSFEQPAPFEGGRGALYYLNSYGRLAFPEQEKNRFLTLIVSPAYLFDRILRGGELNPEALISLEREYRASTLIANSTYDITTRTILEQIVNCPFEGGIKRLYLEGKVMELLATYFNALCRGSSPLPSEERLNRQDVERLKALKELLGSAFDRPLTLNKLAREAGLNEFKLKQGFKKLFGTTVFNHIRELRMQHALQLMLDGESNIGEISARVGYSNPSNFSRNFKKRFGLNPRDYLSN